MEEEAIKEMKKKNSNSGFRESEDRFKFFFHFCPLPGWFPMGPSPPATITF